MQECVTHISWRGPRSKQVAPINSLPKVMRCVIRQAYGGRRGGIVGGYTLLESLGSKDFSNVSTRSLTNGVERVRAWHSCLQDPVPTAQHSGFCRTDNGRCLAGTRSSKDLPGPIERTFSKKKSQATSMPRADS